MFECNNVRTDGSFVQKLQPLTHFRSLEVTRGQRKGGESRPTVIHVAKDRSDVGLHLPRTTTRWEDALQGWGQGFWVCFCNPDSHLLRNKLVGDGGKDIFDFASPFIHKF